MDINTVIPVFMFSLIFILVIIGLIYTIRNNSSLKEVLINKKIIGSFKNLSLIDTESMGINFWNGTMTIYEGYIFIEKTNYFHLIVKDKNSSIRKKTMTISFKECVLGKNNSLIITGTKHRVLSKNTIKIKIKSKNIDDLYRIHELIN